MWRSLHIVYSFHFRHVGDMKNHYAIIGMAHVCLLYTSGVSPADISVLLVYLEHESHMRDLKKE